MKFYLAGAIEAAPDAGQGWRREITEYLSDVHGWQVFDPSREEQDVLTELERHAFRDWKTTDIKRFMPVMKKIIDRDMDELLKQCDAVICFWDRHVIRGGGTHGELTLAYEHRLPVYLVLGMPLAEVSSWIVGCTTQVFQNFDELKAFFSSEKA